MLMTPHATLLYRNAVGQEISLAPLSTFWCQKCEEQIANKIHSQKQVETPGQFFTGMSLDERYITLTGFVTNEITYSNAMRSLQTVFNPTLAGMLYFRNSLTRAAKEIECRISSLPNVYWSRGQMMFDINLVCLDPFWKGKSVVEYIAITMKQFHFKLSIPQGGMSFGIRRRQLESKFENAGNVESGFQAVFRATGGTVTNPEIHNVVTDERIRILYKMQKDDVITVLNTLQEKRVDINGINGFKHIDAPNTKFFKISVGTNRIAYSAEENISNLSVYVRYTPSFTHAEV